MTTDHNNDLSSKVLYSETKKNNFEENNIQIFEIHNKINKTNHYKMISRRKKLTTNDPISQSFYYEKTAEIYEEITERILHFELGSITDAINLLLR